MDTGYSLLLAREIILIDNVFVGAIASFVSTLLALVFFHRFVSAKIEFSRFVRLQYLNRKRRFSYSIKIKQRGLFDLIDVSVHCRLAIHDILRDGGDLWNYYSVPVTFNKSLYWGSGARIIHFHLHELSSLREDSDSLLYKQVVKRIPECGWRLEDILMAFPKVYLCVYVIGHDKFSGTKKLYSSQKYYSFHLNSGYWEKGGLELLPYPPVS